MSSFTRRIERMQAHRSSRYTKRSDHHTVIIPGRRTTHFKGRGILHGHTWTIRAWWTYSRDTDAVFMRGLLNALIARLDHKTLPDEGV